LIFVSYYVKFVREKVPQALLLDETPLVLDHGQMLVQLDLDWTDLD
jgi:hypothetical protein